MTTSSDEEIIRFFRSGGVAYSGPRDDKPIYMVNGRLIVDIRQSFFTISGDRVPGWGNKTFRRARSLGIAKRIISNEIVFEYRDLVKGAIASWYSERKGWVP